MKSYTKLQGGGSFGGSICYIYTTGWYNNNIYDLPDGYTLQIGPSYAIRLGGGGGGGSTTVPSTVTKKSLWGGGAGGYWVGTISGLAQSGLPNTGGGGGGERPYKSGSYQSNGASGGSGTAIFFLRMIL